MTELKGCPFCGSKATLKPLMTVAGVVRSWVIECSECWCDGRWNDAADAITAWNTRAGDGAEMREALTSLETLISYAKWQVFEGADYHPTLPSAVAQAMESLKAARKALPPTSDDARNVREGTMTDAAILFAKPGAVRSEDRDALRDAGVIVVEVENPEDVRLVRPESALPRDELVRALTIGMNTDSFSREAFAKAFAQAVAAGSEAPGGPHD